MTCKQCKYITMCMEEADSLGQVFDTNYDGEHGCTDFVQFTNADRIRAMSDEELKAFVCSILQCEFCKFEGWGGCELLEWLQQPAEGE